MYRFTVLLFAWVGLIYSQSPFCPNTNCASNQTCCTMDDGSPGCCSYQNATCCGVFNQCCPSSTFCDPPTGTCAESGGGTICSGCQAVITLIEAKGCNSAICGVLPAPGNVICEAIMALGICDQIVSWAQTRTPFSICSLLGFCSGGTCACGYCTKYRYGRCLSVPNHCPSQSSFRVKENYRLLPANGTLTNEICFDGTCSQDSLGCCLTCF